MSVPAQLIVGIITAPAAPLPDCLAELENLFGPTSHSSPTIPFNFTDYYAAEMGPNLSRLWLGFARPVARDALVPAKLATNALEQNLARAGRRIVNLDPGILTLHNLVLASTKDYGHRIYLGEGIHAELTLIFRSGRFEPLPWTYPDYRTDACLDFLLACRAHLAGLSTPRPGTT